MTHSSVLNLILNSEKIPRESILNQISKANSLVSEGRYLVTVFDVPNNWNSRISIEGLLISSTLGHVENRNPNWEFYGNGAIRTYKTKSLKLARTLQWNILRRSGDKPFARRSSMSESELTRNTIPVSHKVFTRDVANNVWHLKDEDLQARLEARFSALLAWQDEDFKVVSGLRKRDILQRSKLTLNEDLVGVPTKVPYLWNMGDVLF